MKNYQLTQDHLYFQGFHKLQSVINDINSIIKSKSQYVDFSEIKSDLYWINYYRNQKRYTSVIRWLSNIESSIHSEFHSYMENLSNRLGGNGRSR